MIGSSQQYFYFYTENVKLLNSDNLIQFLENCNFFKNVTAALSSGQDKNYTQQFISNIRYVIDIFQR